MHKHATSSCSTKVSSTLLKEWHYDFMIEFIDPVNLTIFKLTLFSNSEQLYKSLLLGFHAVIASVDHNLLHPSEIGSDDKMASNQQNNGISTS